jgi:hypothetical protein
MILSAKALHRRFDWSVIPELHHFPKKHTKRWLPAALVWPRATSPKVTMIDRLAHPTFDGPIQTQLATHGSGLNKSAGLHHLGPDYTYDADVIHVSV